jgi:hypothetical protein
MRSVTRAECGDRWRNPGRPRAGRALATALLALGCAEPATVNVANAPELGDATEADVRAAMWRLAEKSALLEDLAHDRRGAARHRDRIVALLDDLDRTLDRLDAQRERASERVAALIGRHADTFRADVAAARVDALREPPELARAASIRTSCLHCHAED